MDTLTITILCSVAIVSIALAIDIPTTEWMFKYKPRKKPLSLIQILMRLASQENLDTQSKTQSPDSQEGDRDEVVSHKETQTSSSSAYARSKKIGQKEGTW